MWVLGYVILCVSLTVFSVSEAVSSADISDIEVNNLLAIGSKDEASTYIIEFYNDGINDWRRLETDNIDVTDYGVAIYKGRLLLIGGRFYSNGNLTNRVNEVDLLSGSIKTVSYLNEPRKNPSVVVVGEGRSSALYTMGGILQSGAVTATVEKWDESTQKWINVSDMPAACEGAAVVIHNDNVYIFGGYNGDRYIATVQVYNFKTQLWTIKRPMNGARGHFHGVSDGRYIYVLGGFSDYSNPGSDLSRVDQYDPDNDSWTSIANINYCSGSIGVNFLHDQLYAVGGTYCSRTQIYHKNNNTWQYLNSLIDDRRSHTVVKVPFDLKDYDFNWTPGYRSMKDILVLGFAFAHLTNQMEYYRPESDYWQSKERVEITNTTSYKPSFVNDRLILAGGMYGNRTPANDVFELNIETGEVTPLSPMNIGRYISGLVTVGEGKSARLYAVGGEVIGGKTKTVERWNPFEDTWEYVAPMNVARQAVGLAEHDGYIYAFGGYDSVSMNVTEVYLVDEDRWEFRAPMLRKSYYCSAASDGKYIYVVGGYDGTYVNHVQRYDVSTDSWKILANTTLSYAMGLSIVNNAPTVFGGFFIPDSKDSNIVEAYNAGNDVWERLTPMDNNRLVVAALQVPWKWKNIF